MTDRINPRAMKASRHKAFSFLLSAVLCVYGSAGLALAQSGASAAAENKNSPAQNYFTDTVLINQEGQQMRFYSDLLKDKVVIINSFFTTCTSVCPPMTKTLERIQGWLGDRLGKDVNMISLSVDPETDTPPRLKDYARKFNAKPGWYFLSGKKQNIEFVLRKVGQFVEARDDHSTVLIIGNLRTGLWKKAMGLAKPDDLMKVVESVISDNPQAAK